MSVIFKPLRYTSWAYCAKEINCWKAVGDFNLRILKRRGKFRVYFNLGHRTPKTRVWSPVIATEAEAFAYAQEWWDSYLDQFVDYEAMKAEREKKKPITIQPVVSEFQGRTRDNSPKIFLTIQPFIEVPGENGRVRCWLEPGGHEGFEVDKQPEIPDGQLFPCSKRHTNWALNEVTVESGNRAVIYHKAVCIRRPGWLVCPVEFKSGPIRLRFTTMVPPREQPSTESVKQE